MIHLLSILFAFSANAAEKISGRVSYKDDAGEKYDVIPALNLDRHKYKIIYFDELPLSLAAGS